jgi:hypothetical protein
MSGFYGIELKVQHLNYARDTETDTLLKSACKSALTGILRVLES